MNLHSIVEVIEGEASQPRIFTDKKVALDTFNHLMKENGAEIAHEDDFSIIATDSAPDGVGYSVTLFFDIDA